MGFQATPVSPAPLPKLVAGFKPAIPIRSRYDNWIGGQYVAPARGNYFTNPTPITGQPLCEVARSTHERDVEKALDAAHAAAKSWTVTSPAHRAVILHTIADRIAPNLDTLAFIETIDNGKPIRETTHADMPLAVDHFRYFAGALRAQEGSISEYYGAQCGYCTPGMIMASKALLDKNPHPTRDEVVEGIVGNICRCTGYNKIVDSILASAERMS